MTAKDLRSEHSDNRQGVLLLHGGVLGETFRLSVTGILFALPGGILFPGRRF
jgi:hypothetical protein